jgi:hypothetical protein
MTDFNHLMTQEDDAPDEDSLAKISRLAKAFKQSQETIKGIEDELKREKIIFNKLSQELIPDSMLAVGMTAFQLDTGETVAFKEEVSVTVQDYDSFYKFLEERGDDALMKINLEIGKVPKNILAKMIQTINELFGILATAKMFIHPMTLKKYIKELCGVGGQTEGEITLAELDETMVKTFTFYKTTVK